MIEGCFFRELLSSARKGVIALNGSGNLMVWVEKGTVDCRKYCKLVHIEDTLHVWHFRAETWHVGKRRWYRSGSRTELRRILLLKAGHGQL